MKYFYKERSAKNQCQILGESNGMVTIKLRNDRKFLVLKKNIISEVSGSANLTNQLFDKAFAHAASDLQGGVVKNPKAYGNNIGFFTSSDIFRGLDVDDQKGFEDAREFLDGFMDGIKRALKLG